MPKTATNADVSTFQKLRKGNNSVTMYLITLVLIPFFAHLCALFQGVVSVFENGILKICLSLNHTVKSL